MTAPTIHRPKNWQIGERRPSTTGGVCPNVQPVAPVTEPASEWVTKNLGFLPDKLQAEVLNASENRLLLLCSRQWGKSTILAAKALHHAVSKSGAFILVASASKRQSKEFVLKFNAFAHQALGKAPKSEGEGYRLANGARIIPLPQSPDKVRCYSAPTLIVIDEAAFVKDEFYEAITPALATSNGALWFLSTANEQKGFFHHAWATKADGWKIVKATADECPRISKEFLAGERISKGEAAYMREYFCEFRAGRTQFVDESYIEAMYDCDFKLLGE